MRSCRFIQLHLNWCNFYTLSSLTYIISFLRARNDILDVDPLPIQRKQELPTAGLGVSHKLKLKHKTSHFSCLGFLRITLYFLGAKLL